MNRFEPFRECRLDERRRASRAPLASRLPAFIGLQTEAARVLQGLRVVVVGVGSVGMRAAAHFARLQVGELWLVDPLRCKAESMLTHPLAGPTSMPKSTVAARLCKRISPSTRIFSFIGLVQELPLDAFVDSHLCVMATDNLAAEVEFGRRCLWLGKRLVHSALHGESLTVQVRAFANSNGEGPCPACAFGATEWRQMQAQVRFSCEGGPAAQPAQSLAGLPTRSTSSLCALAADLALNQSLRLVLGLGAPVGDTILEYCGFTNRSVTSRLERNPDCRCDHTHFELSRAPKPLRSYSFAQLVHDFAPAGSNEQITLEVAGANWCDSGRCVCPEPASVRRFVRNGQATAGRCARCRATVTPQPFGLHRAASAVQLGAATDLPLAALGALKSPWVLLRHADGASLIQDPSRTLPAP